MIRGTDVFKRDKGMMNSMNYTDTMDFGLHFHNTRTFHSLQAYRNEEDTRYVPLLARPNLDLHLARCIMCLHFQPSSLHKKRIGKMHFENKWKRNSINV